MDLRHTYIRRTVAAAIVWLPLAAAAPASARVGVEREAGFEDARMEHEVRLDGDARMEREARFDDDARIRRDAGLGDAPRYERGDAFDDARLQRESEFDDTARFDDTERPGGFVPMLAPRNDRFVPARSDLERETRREGLRPPTTGAYDDDWMSPHNRLLWLSREAMVRGVVGDLEGAAAAWESAIGIGQDSIGAWRKLARIRLRQERVDATESALLWATHLAEQRPEFGAQERAAAWRDLGELYLDIGYPRDAGEALDHALEIFDDDRTRALLGHARRQVQAATGVRAPEATDPVPELFPPNEIEERRARIEARFAELPEPLRGWLTFEDGRVDYLRLAQSAGVLLIVLCGLPFLRRKGEIAVRIAYPDSLEGRFWVAVTAEAGKIKRPAAGEAPPRRMRNALGFKPNVSREVHFGRIRTGRAVVTLYGELQDITSGEVLTTPFEEQTLQVKSRAPAEVVFDLRPRDCPVDVHVRWDKRKGSEIGVVARGLPSSLRYASDGKLRMRLPMGTHTVIVGSEDRVAEVEVVVDSFRPQTLMVDLAGNEHVVFKGCPPAVQPYLLGDLQASARALEQDGHAQAAHLLLARLHQMNGSPERAAEQLESAGQTLEAARLRDSISDFERAAALYENAGSIIDAAASYRNAGLHDKAGELFASVAQLSEAEACYRASGNDAALVGVLERQRQFMEAADLAEAAGDRAQAVRLLQQVTTADPDYAASCKRLALAFKAEGHADLAANKYEAYVAAVGRSSVSGDESMDLAAFQIEADLLDRALDTLEDLRNREPTHPGVAQSIESLRKRITARKAESSGGAGQVTSVPTQFVSDHRYEILAEIGRGGMGVIFKARDRRLNRIVALKRLPENLREHPKAVKLFLNEAQAAARLNHPNIVTVHDTDQEDGTFFITMELLEGYPLNVVLRKRGKLNARDTLKIGMQVAVGLQYAHAQQVVHRDIKTSNLFITREKTVKIMDFGLAKMMEEVRRGSTVVGGTPYYMAPEQAAGETIDHRADIYAFGVTLFEFITGRVPFQEGDVQYHHRHTAPPDPRSVEPGCPDELAELILEMMAKSPDDRVENAAAVGARLEAILAEI